MPPLSGIFRHAWRYSPRTAVFTTSPFLPVAPFARAASASPRRHVRARSACCAHTASDRCRQAFKSVDAGVIYAARSARRAPRARRFPAVRQQHASQQYIPLKPRSTARSERAFRRLPQHHEARLLQKDAPDDAALHAQEDAARPAGAPCAKPCDAQRRAPSPRSFPSETRGYGVTRAPFYREPRPGERRLRRKRRYRAIVAADVCPAKMPIRECPQTPPADAATPRVAATARRAESAAYAARFVEPHQAHGWSIYARRQPALYASIAAF